MQIRPIRLQDIPYYFLICGILERISCFEKSRFVIGQSWSRDLYRAIWLDEFTALNINKKNRISPIIYCTSVRWPVSCDVIGWICCTQCKQRNSSNIADNLFYSSHVTRSLQSDWLNLMLIVNKEDHQISLITYCSQSRDLYPIIWLVEIGALNVNKENYQISLET